MMNLQYFSIAGFVIAVENIDNTYFSRRMKEYEVSSAAADITIRYTLCGHINPPAAQAQRKGERSWVYDNGRYYFYDTAPSGECVACIAANRDWSEIDARLIDVFDMGGAPLDIRSFNMVGEIFKYFLITRGGIVLHSSSLIYKGEGIAFSAPSGTGKSTHTSAWGRMYKDDVCIINDDSPAIRFENGKAIIYGTPWSGKTEINSNKSVDLKSVVFIARGNENRLEPMAHPAAFVNMLSGVANPVYHDLTELLLGTIQKILQTVKVFKLECNISDEAVITASKALS